MKSLHMIGDFNKTNLKDEDILFVFFMLKKAVFYYISIVLLK